MLLVLQLVLAASFTSTGFVTIPPQVKLGAMSAVEVDPKGNIYVLHRGEPPLLRFNPQGEYVKGWGEGMFKVAHGLRADHAGNIWTTDNGNHVLRKFSPDGVLLQTVGEVNVGSGDETHFRSPDDLVFSTKGDIYVADSGNGRIVHLDPQGKFIGQWGKKGKGEGEFTTAHGLAIDKKNRVYVADRGNNRVQVFDGEGKFIAVWDGFGNPFGLHIRDNQLLISEGDVNKIFHFGLDSGKLEETWGDSQTLQLPHLMASDRRGNLYIAEVNGKRVQIFRRR